MKRPGALSLSAALGAALLCAPVAAQDYPGPDERPLPATVSWLGNSFGGGGERWVQNYIDEIEVAPDGTVYTASTWDENGRCAGIYTPDGGVIPERLRQYDGKGGHKAWGYGTAGRAVAIDDTHVFLVNTEGELLRFRRADRGYVDTLKGVGKAVGMTHAAGRLFVVLEDGRIQVRPTSDLSLSHEFTVPGATDLAVDAKGTLWVLAGKQVVHCDDRGKTLPGAVTDAGDPRAVAVDHRGRLVVCDDGPRQQVLFYDVSGPAPKRAATFGVEGGLRAGTPGVPAPDKLYNLAGADTDDRGNLYVACSGGIGDGTVLRKFGPDGKPAWELHGLLFVDTPAFDPASDGAVVYSGEERFTLDYSRAAGREATLAGYTLDPLTDDPRRKDAALSPAFARRLGGKTVLYYTNQHPVAYHFYTGEGKGEFLRFAGTRKRDLDDAWGFFPDSRGDLWQVAGKTIAVAPFEGFAADGSLRFGEVKRFDAPAPFSQLMRVHYDREGDVLYLAGYTPEKKSETWGLVGKVLARYDRWSQGNRTPRWTVDLPHVYSPKNLPEPKRPFMKAMAIAGDYVFLAGVVTRGKVWVYRTEDGAFVGNLLPDASVGGVANTGWPDTPYAIDAVRRKNGEYAVLLEEDARAKFLLYRWKPEGGR